MKYFLALLMLTICVSSCQTERPSTISGTADGVYNGIRLYLKKGNAQGTPVNLDTAIVMNGKFDFGLPNNLKDGERVFLFVDGTQGNLVLIAEDTPIHIQLHKDSLMTSEVQGGFDNDVFTDYKKIMLEHSSGYNNFRTNGQKLFKDSNPLALENLKKQWQKTDQLHKVELEKLFTANTTSHAAPIILEYLYQTKFIDEIKTRKLYNLLDDEIKSNPIALQIDEELERVEIVSIGRKAPYFEGKNPGGDLVKLPETLGKVTLIDFWASWCVPCRVENPNVVEAYAKYHDKGFNIISVSLDKPDERQQWIDAIEKDQMTWNHISRLQHWQDPIAALYNVKGIPATFLLDENGVIIDKNLRGQDLHHRLSELLN